MCFSRATLSLKQLFSNDNNNEEKKKGKKQIPSAVDQWACTGLLLYFIRRRR